MHNQTFGFLVFPGLEELDLIGPWEMITMWHEIAQGPRAVSIAESSGLISCRKGLHIMPDYTISDCPSLDFLLVPGGMGTRTERYNEKLINFISDQSQHCQAVLSVCTGALLLYQAGLLMNRSACTHHRMFAEMSGYEGVEMVAQRYIQDGPIWTSAGVSAGTDMALAFIAHVAGPEVAGRIQLETEYYPDDVLYPLPDGALLPSVYDKT